MELKQRTSVDFSKHIVIETHFKNENHSLDVWDLKLPDSQYMHRVRFINSCGVLTVDGDFGRWTFCREFHPSPDGYVSDHYWQEKLSISSKQTYSKYDPDKTRAEITHMIKKGLEDYGYEGEQLEKLKENFTELLDYVDDELEYTYYAYRELCTDMDHEYIPFCKTTYTWLEIVFDAFEELVKREKLKVA